MKNIAWIAIVILIAGGGYWLWQNSAQPTGEQPASGTETPSATSSPSETNSETPAPANSFTMAEVAEHNTDDSCWSAIDGSVYDLTVWVSQHPGGRAAILSLCGKDGTAAFHGQHGDAQKQAAMLATMKIGVLAQ